MFSALFKETLAPLALRLALAAIFIVHGWEKVYEHDGGASWADHVWADQQKIPPEVENKVKTALAAEKRRLLEDKDSRDFPADFRKKVEQLEADTLSGIGTEYSRSAGKMPEALGHNIAQLAVAWGELLGGIAMALGLLARLAALGLIVIQAGAIWTVTYALGFAMDAGPGYEYNIAIIAMCVALVFLGGGRLSVDHLFRRKRKSA
jgi:uncharacterized membrane protein YphA (DoxX/SURF4 family)